MAMHVKVLKEDGLNREFEITLPAAEIDQRIDARLKDVGKTLRIDGFRPGKVPLPLLKKKYGRAVMGEVLEIAVNETSAKALQDNSLKPALQPKIEVKSFDEGQDLTYTMSLEILPEIKITDMKSLKLQKHKVKVEDTEINAALERIAESNPRTQPVQEDRASRSGDTVVIDFAGRTADDNKAHDGMSAKGVQLKIGSNRFIPGFEDQLVGFKKGADVVVKVAFPADYGAKELAGRDAIFDVTINELEEEAEVKIDDDFAKSLGLADVEALRKAVTEQIEKEFDGQARMLVKKSLLDALDEAHKFQIPQGMLEIEVQNILDQVTAHNKEGGSEVEISEEEKTEYREIADRRVRLGLVLAEIGMSNNISVADVELQRAVIDEARKYPGQERQVFDYFAKNRQALETLRAPLFEEKVVDYVLELASVSVKEITADELRSLLTEDEDDAESRGEIVQKPKSKSKKKAAS
jgi:trigger factor